MVGELGRYFYTVQGWVDSFETWSRQFAKRVEAGQDITQELEVAARMIEAAAARADGSDSNRLQAYAAAMRKGRAAASAALGGELAQLMDRYADKSLAVTYPRELGGRRRSRASAFFGVVRAVPAVSRRARQARHVRRCRGPPAGDRRDGLRRALSAAHPPHRPHQSKRGEQLDNGRPRRARQPLGDRLGRGRAQVDQPAPRHARRLSPPGGRPPASTDSRWRSTSRSSARPTTRTRASTRSGSGTGPTARSSTRRTRRRSTRTSFRSTSRPRAGASCGTSCCRSSSTGSTRA